MLSPNTPTTALASSIESPARPDRKLRIALTWAALLSSLLAAVGIALGIVMAVHRTVVECEDGHYFPEGTTDFRCFSYPHAGLGTSIAVLAAMTGIAIGVLVLIAFKVVEGPAVPPEAAVVTNLAD